MALSGNRPKFQPLKPSTAELDQLPPHNLKAEQEALGCVLFIDNNAEADSLLRQLRTSLFYDLRHQKLFTELVTLRMENHALNKVTLDDWLRGRKTMDAIGGYNYLGELIDQVTSIANFASCLQILETHALRRHVLARSAELSELSRKTELSSDDLRAEFLSLVEKTDRMTTRSRPMIEVWTIEQVKAYVPDPSTWLIGEDIVSRGELSVMAGPPGVGKTRWANTLAFAGARGNGTWTGYQVKRRFRTLVLQSENNPRRIQSEVKDVPKEWHDYVRFSMPCVMQFSSPAFRQELLRIYEGWPFDLLILDNMNDVARADGREDFLEALDFVRMALPPFPNTPALMILTHLRKSRGGEMWKPKRGRQLLDELPGSFALGARARTVLVIQPGSNETDDDMVVTDCAKSNNDVPFGMTAWHRKNVAFELAPDFDLDAWLVGPDEGRKIVTEEILAEIFQKHGPSIDKHDLVKLLQSEEGFSQSTAYKAVDLKKSKFKDRLWETQNGRLGWK